MPLPTENISMRASVAVIGPTAAGKEELSVGQLAPRLDELAIITGNSVRAAALRAREVDLLETRSRLMLLRPHAAETIRDWFTGGLRSFHFEHVGHDTKAHIFFEGRDMNADIHPRHTRENLEPIAAHIATHPLIRRAMYEFWRDTIIRFGGAVVVTKTPHAYMKEAPVVALSIDDYSATGYRFKRHINVFPTFEGELAYVRSRNETHRKHHLEGIPQGAFVLDMSPYLMHRGGMAKAADRVQEFLGHRAFRGH